jgi:O-acetyl-ADP-ribose deacetylase (regulator of RNase III)
MIHLVEGDLLESKTEAIVNTVNTVGISGKGIALQFKNLFPNNDKLYKKACKEGTIAIGKLFVTEEESLFNNKRIIINFPTKKEWRKPSEYSYIEKGLKDLVTIIRERKIKSIAIPPLGAGNGGLIWSNVVELIENYLSKVDCEIYIFQPNYIIKESLKKERVPLTPARAMLLAVLFELVRNGEFVSEFAAEKVAYFLQRFGAKQIFKLEFQPNFYGPYSGKVKHVLYFLNGSYIAGYKSKDKKPFEELELMMDAENSIVKYLQKPENKEYEQIVTKTKNFLTGYYSSFSLELLSTVDFIVQTDAIDTIEHIQGKLDAWSERKRKLLSNPKFLKLAVQNLKNFGLAVN